MQSNQLQKAINLTKKTGDRLIIFDKSESEEPYVVMTLNDYEKLVIGHSEVRGLTENELLDKINRDIAVWKSDSEISEIGQQTNNFNNKIEGSSIKEENRDFDGYTEPENVEDEEEDDIEDMYKDDFSSPGLKEMRKSLTKKGNISKGSWSIPSERKNAAEEVVDEDEERQYLEELPF